jgi:hypothetical protein
MKYDLSLATFIIPIRIESVDRLRNIITIVAFLLDNFNTNVLIKEVDTQSVFEKEALPILGEVLDFDFDIQHIFEKSNDSSFHRQRIINEMIIESKTKIIVNYDCDVILPIDSYIDAYQLILNNESDVVYPYGQGSYQKQVFATDEIVSRFLESGDYSYLDNNSKSYLSDFGWVQFFNRDVYIEGGMENENFVAYAPEDKERFYRFTKLGYRIKRIDNVVYHLEHSRGHNSWLNNPHMSSNNQLWEDLQKLDKEHLKEYYLNQDYLKKYNGQK